MTGAVRYEIEHLSRYCYTAPAQQCVMLLCLEPREDRGQRLLDFEIETQPPANLNRETDWLRQHAAPPRPPPSAPNLGNHDPRHGRGRVRPATPSALAHRCLGRDPLPWRIVRLLGLHAPERIGAPLARTHRIRRPASHRAYGRSASKVCCNCRTRSTPACNTFREAPRRNPPSSTSSKPVGASAKIMPT